MDKKVMDAIHNNKRYSDFTILDEPVKFCDLFYRIDSEVVQLHSIELCGDGDIVGFCGVFEWFDNKISPLDGDVYYDDMLVYGYSWFDDKECGVCLEVLVDEW